MLIPTALFSSLLATGMYVGGMSVGASNKIINGWRRDSGFRKVELTFFAVYLAIIACAAVYVFFGKELGLDHSIDLKMSLDGKSDEEILEFILNDLLLFIVIFLSSCLLGGILVNALRTFAIFNLSRWLHQNGIDSEDVFIGPCLPAVYFVRSGFLLRERPSCKSLIIYKLLGEIALGTIFVFSAVKFIETMAVQAYEIIEVENQLATEWLKQTFSGSEAIFFYIMIVAFFGYGIVMKRIIRTKQDSLVNCMEADDGE